MIIIMCIFVVLCVCVICMYMYVCVCVYLVPSESNLISCFVYYINIPSMMGVCVCILVLLLFVYVFISFLNSCINFHM